MKIIVPLAEGFEEIEFSTIVDILRRAGADVITAGLKEGAIDGCHGIKVISDCLIGGINPDEFDVAVLPGGFPGFINLGEDKRVINLIKEMYRKDKYVTAICGAPSVLSKAGILKSKKATIHPTCREVIKDARYIDERVVIDGKIVTSQGPGTAMEFLMKLVELLFGRDKVKEINGEVLARL